MTENQKMKADLKDKERVNQRETQWRECSLSPDGSHQQSSASVLNGIRQIT